MRQLFVLLALFPSLAFGQSPQLNLSQLAYQLRDGGLIPSSALYQLWPETTAERSVSGLTITNYMHPPGNVYRYGAVGNGGTDDSAAVQDAIYQACSGRAGAAAAYLPTPSVRYLMSQSVTVSTNNGCEIYGDGKYQTYIRYTGTGAWLSSTYGNQAFNIHDFTLQLAGYKAVGLDISQMWGQPYDLSESHPPMVL